MISLTLPWPPGVNNLFATVRGPKGTMRRIATRRYKAWMSEAFVALTSQGREHVAGRVRVEIVLNPPDARIRDADGYLKAPIDFLVRSGVLQGDSREHVKGASAEWSDAAPAKPGSINITLRAA